VLYALCAMSAAVLGRGGGYRVGESDVPLPVSTSRRESSEPAEEEYERLPCPGPARPLKKSIRNGKRASGNMSYPNICMYLFLYCGICIFGGEAYERLPCPGPARPLK